MNHNKLRTIDENNFYNNLNNLTIHSRQFTERIKKTRFAEKTGKQIFIEIIYTLIII